MRDVVKGGTPNHACDLCTTCRRATLIQGMKLSDAIRRCAVLERDIPFKVSSCSNYDDVRIPDLYDMKKTAWILTTKQGGRQIGFSKRTDLKESEKDEIDAL